MRVDDLEILVLYHCSDTTSKTFNTTPGLSGLKTFNIAVKAPKYLCLHGGILAVSALHLQSVAADTVQQRRIIYADRAIAHQQLVLSSYTSHLDSIT